MDSVYNVINDYNPNKKLKNSIILDDLIADIMTKKIFLDVGNSIYLLYSSNNLIFLFWKKSD